MSYLERLKSEFPEKRSHEALTKPTEAPFVSSVSTPFRHISEIHPIVLKRVQAACDGLIITPGQFQALLSEEDKVLIRQGRFSRAGLRAYAMSFAEGIRLRRILFYPTSQTLLNHGLPKLEESHGD